MIADPPEQERTVIARFVDAVEQYAEAIATLEKPLQGSKRGAKGAHALLLAPGQEPIELPESLYHVLRDAAEILKAGDAVMLAPLHKQLTTTEAADLLGVSRQYLTRLIDRNEIACERVNRHRRLRLGDVLKYRDDRQAHRRRAVAALTADSAALGAYD